MTRKAPITELMGPKKGMASATNHRNNTTGIRTKIRSPKLRVWTLANFSHTRNTGWTNSTNTILCSCTKTELLVFCLWPSSHCPSGLMCQGHFNEVPLSFLFHSYLDWWPTSKTQSVMRNITSLTQAAGCFIDGQLKVVYMYNIYPPSPLGLFQTQRAAEKGGTWCKIIDTMANVLQGDGGRTAKAFDRCRRISPKAQ